MLSLSPQDCCAPECGQGCVGQTTDKRFLVLADRFSDSDPNPPPSWSFWAGELELSNCHFFPSTAG